MSDRSEKRAQIKMFWSVSTKNETYTSLYTCKESFKIV